MGHFCGALAGLLVGIAVLDNRVVETWEIWVDINSVTTIKVIFSKHYVRIWQNNQLHVYKNNLP